MLQQAAQSAATGATPSLSHHWDNAAAQTDELRLMKKFRFQLLHRWLVTHFAPCRVADVAGGKGLLAYLLQESGWETAVIDPTPQSLPDKYKTIDGQRVRIPPTARVRRITRPFHPDMAGDFDLLVGMHAHGCNAQIIDAAAASGCGFILFPCCIIDEPFLPAAGEHWLASLIAYAAGRRQPVHPFRLNFRGQHIGLCAVGNCRLVG